jgi:hypothetical protein
MLVKNEENQKKRKSKIHLEFLQNWKLEAVMPKKKETNELIKSERKKNKNKKTNLCQNEN